MSKNKEFHNTPFDENTKCKFSYVIMSRTNNKKTIPIFIVGSLRLAMDGM